MGERLQLSESSLSRWTWPLWVGLGWHVRGLKRPRSFDWHLLEPNGHLVGLEEAESSSFDSRFGHLFQSLEDSACQNGTWIQGYVAAFESSAKADERSPTSAATQLVALELGSMVHHVLLLGLLFAFSASWPSVSECFGAASSKSRTFSSLPGMLRTCSSCSHPSCRHSTCSCYRFVSSTELALLILLFPGGNRLSDFPRVIPALSQSIA